MAYDANDISNGFIYKLDPYDILPQECLPDPLKGLAGLFQELSHKSLISKCSIDLIVPTSYFLDKKIAFCNI